MIRHGVPASLSALPARRGWESSSSSSSACTSVGDLEGGARTAPAGRTPHSGSMPKRSQSISRSRSLHSTLWKGYQSVLRALRSSAEVSKGRQARPERSDGLTPRLGDPHSMWVRSVPFPIGP